MTRPTYRSVDVDGFEVFYREAGDPGKPSLLLLHGFPTSSHMFRDLIPLLADRFHLVAPDLPGFGRWALPVPRARSPTASTPWPGSSGASPKSSGSGSSPSTNSTTARRRACGSRWRIRTG